MKRPNLWGRIKGNRGGELIDVPVFPDDETKKTIPVFQKFVFDRMSRIGIEDKIKGCRSSLHSIMQCQVQRTVFHGKRDHQLLFLHLDSFLEKSVL